MTGETPELQSRSHMYSISAHRSVPNYTAWQQWQMCEQLVQTRQPRVEEENADLWWRLQTPCASRIRSEYPSWAWGKAQEETCGFHRDRGMCSETPRTSDTQSRCSVASQRMETSPTCTETNWLQQPFSGASILGGKWRMLCHWNCRGGEKIDWNYV